MCKHATWWMTLALLAGCSGDGLKLAPAEGIVTLNGQPVENAGVMFLPVSPAKAPPASGSTDKQGHFTMMTNNRAGAPVGEHRVSICKADPFGDEVQEKDLEMADVMRRKGLKLFQTKYLIPEQYANVETSKLTATVENKSNQFEFKLTTP